MRKAPPAAQAGHSAGAGNSTAQRLPGIPERGPVEDDLEGDARKHKERKLPLLVRDQIERVKRNLKVNSNDFKMHLGPDGTPLLGHMQDRSEQRCRCFVVEEC